MLLDRNTGPLDPDSSNHPPEPSVGVSFTVLSGALIGVLAALVTFGFDFFRGDPAYWDYLWGDAGSGLAALRYYLDDGWGFPLLQANGINSPDGINVAFTDSIPLLALTAKLLRPLGFAPEQWWAWWYLFIYAAQGAAAAYAVRCWGSRSALTEACVAVVAVSAPILLLRTWHPGLAGQFTLLLAWAFVGNLRRGRGDQRRILASGALLIVVSLLIHVYLMVGVVIVVVGGVLNEWAQQRLRRRDVGWWFALLLGNVAVLGIVFGYFSAGAARAGGYYLVGMHLLGPVVPQWSTLWPGDEWIIDASGSFEAFNWLGFGWLGIIMLALAISRHSVIDFIRRYQVLAALLVLLTAYSITPVIRVRDDNPHDLRTPLRWIFQSYDLHGYAYGAAATVAALATLEYLRRNRTNGWRYGGIALSIPVLIWGLSMLTDTVLIDAVTGQFRSAGRLFWVVSYGLLVVGGARIGSRTVPMKRPLLAVSIAALALVQVIDVAAFRTQAGQTLDPTPERIERIDAIVEALQGAERINIEPAYNCVVAQAGFEGIWAYQDVGIAASLETIEILDAYAARRPNQDCGPIVPTDDPTTLLVVVARPDFQPSPTHTCDALDIITVCQTTE